MRVKIDGVETVLTYDCFSGARGHQYLTPGNASSHAFRERLQPGQKFRTNGHTYEVLASAMWRCLTCARTGNGFAPACCPSCGSEHDVNHGPQEGK